MVRRPPLPPPPVWEQGRVPPTLARISRGQRRIPQLVVAAFVVAAVLWAPAPPARLVARAGRALDSLSDGLAARAFAVSRRAPR